MSQSDASYLLDEQIGFVLRRVTQRHIAIFSEAIPEVTTTQFAALAKLMQLGPLSQNHLGRVTAMDGATIKGVVDRLRAAGLVRTEADPGDRRRLTVDLSDEGRALLQAALPAARQVSERTVAPLSAGERDQLLALLSRLV